MIKKVILLLSYLALITFTFSACSKKEVWNIDYTYLGENELWIAEYHVTGTEQFSESSGKLEYSNDMKDILTVSYKGELEDLSDVKYMKISYECNNQKGSMESEYSEGDEITSKTFKLISGGTNTAKVGDNEIIKVTIDVDGEIQNIELKRN